jgi:uncharacterized repeat protein (TIGR04138 family)
MPPTPETDQFARMQRVAQDMGVYPLEAYDFVRHGLDYTVKKVHGADEKAGQSRHVSGQQLCEGLRIYAQRQWGYMARMVLQRWNITSTLDFGRIVFSMVEHQMLSTTEQDTIEDFRHVYDFRKSMETEYRVAAKLA